MPLPVAYGLIGDRFKLLLPNPIDYTLKNMTDLLRTKPVELMMFAPVFLVVLGRNGLSRANSASVYANEGRSKQIER